MLSLLSAISRGLSTLELVLTTATRITESCNAGLTSVNATVKSAHAARKAISLSRSKRPRTND